ncbi:unnamed protein product [Tilletia caries]|nr:unnamed protein product [Tilletia caries]
MGVPPWTRTYDGGGNGSMAKRYGDWRSIAQYAPRDIKLYVDESSDWVIDIWWDGRSAAYRLRTDWRSHGNGRDIQFAEALAIEVGLLHVFATGLRSAALIVYTDNTGVQFGVPRGRMRNEAATIVIERIHDLQVRHDVVVHTRRVASADNPADEPSRPFPQSYFPLALPRSSFPTRSHPRTDIGKDKQHVKKARIPERSQSSRPSLAALRAARQKTMKIQAASAPSAASNRRRSTPQPLTVARSSLRPDFLAHQRLSSWRPVTALQGTHLSFEEVASVSAAMADSYSEDTLKSYGSGLARWHQWCDHPGVPEQLRCPAPAELLKSFILQHTGHFSSDTIGTWLSGLRAWHRIWNQSWPAGNMRRTELIRYAALHTPSTSRNPARPAVTLEWLSAILSVVKLNSPGNVAAAAAASVALWGLLRLGETKCLPKNFDQRKNISRTGLLRSTSSGSPKLYSRPPPDPTHHNITIVALVV